MQFRWVNQVNQSQQRLTTQSLDEALECTIEDLESKLWMLLAAFRSNAALNMASRPGYYRQFYYLWHELSWQGPAVARVLIFDLDESGPGILSEIGAGPGGFREVAWGKDLAQVRNYIKEYGFKRGRGVKARWTATWTYIPEAMALCRPMVAHVPSSRAKQDWPAVTGYLILQLDQDYLRDRLIPEVLEERFGGGSDANARYEVSIALNGESLLSYVRLEDHGPEGAAPAAPESIHRPNWQRVGRASVRGGPPDRAYPFMLSQIPVVAQ